MAKYRTRTKAQTSSLGDLQLAILEVLWARGEATFADIRRDLAARAAATTTVATVLGRLERSGLVAHSGGERSRVYRALAPRAAVRTSQARGLIDRLFNGRPSELVSHLVRESDLDETELHELRRLLNSRKAR